MNRLFNAAAFYAVLGLLGGLFYREMTKMQDFPADQFTQLSVVHTHSFALGMLFFLIVLALEKPLALSSAKFFGAFFWTYNVGVVLTIAMLLTHGTMTVLGTAEVSPAISGIAGLGHIIITVGLVFFFINVKKAINAARQHA